MAWFGQGKDTIEWEEFRDDVLFFKWPAKEIKKGARLVIRAGQRAIFYANGVIEGIFEQAGNYDIVTEIVPFLSTLKGVFSLRGDTGLRAEVYFVNSKELLLTWGTRQRIMIPTAEVPSGIPVGCNGNMIIEFRDYVRFIDKVAGVKDTYTLDNISERIMGELNPIIAEAILGGNQNIGVNALISLQGSGRKLGAAIKTELDKELMDFGMGAVDVNILSINYPEDVQKMVERVAGQSFVTNVGKYAAVQMADGFAAPGGGNDVASFGAQVAMGAQMAQQMTGAMGMGAVPAPAPSQVAGGAGYACTACGFKSASPMKFCPECGSPMAAVQQNPVSAGDRFCPSCRKMVFGKFCPDCGTQTV
jgi:membrane protease subunit (stomatin/prohibitin family)